MVIRIGLLLLLLSTVSCAVGGDLHRSYVISQASEEVPQGQEVDLKED